MAGYNPFGDLFGSPFGDIFSCGDGYSDKLDIQLQKSKYEENLDAMWKNYCKGFTQQIVAYNQQVDKIKKSGFKVLRNSDGKHKIVERK